MTHRGSPERRSPFLLGLAFFGGVLVLFIGISFAQELRRRVILQQHVDRLQQEIHTREDRIANLRKLTEYLKTDAYRERAAREKLNYQRPGENVVVIPESGTALGVDAPAASEAESRETPIPRQWWNLFFSQSSL
jgi:cell division protein FtsB